MKKQAYLTIDDSPSEFMKQKVDYLYSKKIPAIFFCEGKNIEKYENAVIYAIMKGFIIGNHSYDHPHFSRLSLGEAFKQIKKTDKIIDVAYRKAHIKRPIKIFRFPYGDKGIKSLDYVSSLSKKVLPPEAYKKLKRLLQVTMRISKRKDKIQQYLKRLSYRQPAFKINYPWFKLLRLNKDMDVYWTFNCEEYVIKDLNKVFRNIEKVSKHKSNDIILIHDHADTNEKFFKIIDQLQKKVSFILPEL